MKKLLVAFMIGASCLFAGGNDVSLKDIQIPITSRHYTTDMHRIKTLNEDNQGFLVGVKTKLPVIFRLGTFKNAYNRQAFFFGVENGVDLGLAEVGVTGGLATGYDNPILVGTYVETKGVIGGFGTRIDYTYSAQHDVMTFGLSVVYRF